MQDPAKDLQWSYFEKLYLVVISFFRDVRSGPRTPLIIRYLDISEQSKKCSESEIKTT